MNSPTLFRDRHMIPQTNNDAPRLTHNLFQTDHDVLGIDTQSQSNLGSSDTTCVTSGDPIRQSPRSEFQRPINHQTIIARTRNKERKQDLVRQLFYVLGAKGRRSYLINRVTRVKNWSKIQLIKTDPNREEFSQQLTLELSSIVQFRLQNKGTTLSNI